MMNDGRNFFIWLIFMVAIFIILGVLETALEVPDIGEHIMSLESSIILTLCLMLASEGRPVLPIHDELIVKATDAEFVEHTMIEQYREAMGFAPVVERDFHD